MTEENMMENRRKEIEGVRIRIAEEKDAEQLLKIYAPYVTRTAITFEYEVPSLEEFTGRIRKILKKYPYLVAEKDGRILGYAYAGTFKDRAAYDWSVETTIYVDSEKKKSGIGRKLYEAMERILKEQNLRNLYACIGYPKEEDEYLTRNSVEFHAHSCYRLVGEFYDCGYKFGRWYNMVWMEKRINTDQKVLPVKWFGEYREELERLLEQQRDEQE